MNRQCLIIIALILTNISCSEKLSNEIYFFENLDFKSGNYKILVYGVEGEWIEDYKDFYIDDTQTLEKMKKQWMFDEKSEIMPCGYGYELYLVDKNKIIKNAAVNIDCEYMSGWIKFPKGFLTDHKKTFKRMSDEDKLEFQKKYFEN